MRLFMIALIGVSGFGLAVQAAVNARLRVGVESPALGALISFLVGTLGLVLLTLSGILGRGRVTHLSTLPWWAWIGGVLGAVYVTAAIIALPRIGAAVVIACAVAGQLVGSLALDTFGWFDVPRIPLNPWRILGAVLLFCGVLLMQRK